MSGLLAGPGCGRCAATEQRCAYVGGCCALCTHTFGQEPAPTPQRLVRTVTADDPRVLHLVAQQHSAPTDDDCLPDGLIAQALLLVAAVRSRSPQLVADVLDGASSVRDLAVCLAALVPSGKTAVELLAWNDGQPGDRGRATPLRPCGTHAAFVRHTQVRREEPCEECVLAERAYQRARAQRRAAERARVTVAS